MDPQEESGLFFPGRLLVVSIPVQLGFDFICGFHVRNYFKTRVPSLSFFMEMDSIICSVDEQK